MLRIHFLDVGNGDCTVLEHISEGVKSFGLVDCNSTTKRPSPARDKLIELGAKHLDFVYISHPDTDHFSGIFDVLSHYRGRIAQFGTFPFEKIYTDTELLKKYFSAINDIIERGDDAIFRKKLVELMKIIRFAHAELLDCWIEVSGDFEKLGVPGFADVDFYAIMPPRRVKGPYINDVATGGPLISRSIDNNEISSAVVVKYAGVSVVLGGDAPAEHWEAHQRYREKARVDIASVAVKLPHHGSKYDNTLEGMKGLFAAENPFAVISADGKRHPDLETLSLMDELRVTRLCTGLSQPFAKVKKLQRDLDVSQRLQHYLNVYADAVDGAPSSCKGDITLTVTDDGRVSVQTQHATICGCTRSFADLLSVAATPADRPPS